MPSRALSEMVAMPYVYGCKTRKRTFDTFTACRYACRDLPGRPYKCGACDAYHWMTSTRGKGRKTQPPPGTVLLSGPTRFRWDMRVSA